MKIQEGSRKSDNEITERLEIDSLSGTGSGKSNLVRGASLRDFLPKEKVF